MEVDDFVHETSGRPEHDIRRTAWLASQEIDVMRIPAAEVFSNRDEVIARIWDQVWLRLRAVGL